MEFTLTVRVCRSFTVNDQWAIAWKKELAIQFTAPLYVIGTGLTTSVT